MMDVHQSLTDMAEQINILADFCGIRDVPELTQQQLRKKYGTDQADVMVLFGGSILCGGDVLAHAMNNHIAKKYIIVGGEGHTTQTLRAKMQEAFPALNTEGLSEAAIFNAYLQYRFGLKADYLECRSTNCGNNITYLLELLQEQHIPCESIILSQDATMQRRMDATLKRYPDAPRMVINYAVYRTKVACHDGRLIYTDPVWGMWDMEWYINLLMGEIPRLTDNASGYGPRGQGFIAHVDIPPEVDAAFRELQKIKGFAVREANPLYASVQ